MINCTYVQKMDVVYLCEWSWCGIHSVGSASLMPQLCNGVHNFFPKINENPPIFFLMSSYN